MICSRNKKLLLTGATGLLGKVIVQPLIEAGFEVSALTIDKINPDNGVNWINCNLFDSKMVSTIFSELKPSYLMNLAWITTGDYLVSNSNFDFLCASIDLLKNFAKNGGKRAVFSGTCFEYKFKGFETLKEYDELSPMTIYGKCKNWTREISEIFCKNNDISFAWGRIFNLFGSNEAPTRLTGSIIKNISEGKMTTIKSGKIVRDYIYVKDVAMAFVALLNSDTNGIVNICSGNPVSIEKFARTLAHELGAENLLNFVDQAGAQVPYIVGDNSRLVHEVGFTPKFNLESAIKDIVCNL